MNIQHMRYAIEVDRHGSISRAAEALYMNQPNLSKAIRELESSLGITIFKRNSKGVAVTSEGERFLSYARGVLAKIDEMEALYKPSDEPLQYLRVSTPHSAYIAKAFAAFAAGLDTGLTATLHFYETSAMQAMRNITDRDFKLGIIRYRAIDEALLLAYLSERELAYSQLIGFECVALMHRHGPLAGLDSPHCDDLAELTEIVYEDAKASGMPDGDRGVAKGGEETKRLIYVSGRGSMMDLLSANMGCFAWSEPIPEDIMGHFNLVQKKCGGINMHHKDILIYPRGYSFTPLEKAFVGELEQMCDAVRRDILKSSI